MVPICAASRRVSAVGITLTVIGVIGCQTTDDARRVDAEETTGPIVIEGWTAGKTLARDQSLEEAAVLLCSRDTDAVIDDDVRRATGVRDAQVAGAIGRGATLAEAKASLASQTTGVLDPVFPTHVGVVIGQTPDAKVCVAAVVARRHADIQTLLPPTLPEPTSLVFTADLHAGRFNPVLYVAHPDGSVDRRPLQATPLEASPKLGGRVDESIRLNHGEGNYTLELVVNVGPDEPEIAMLWNIRVGTKPRVPPAPDVLFPDAGHPNKALTRRAEALVSRLRTTQLLDTMKISPSLSRVASRRARSLADVGVLGHKIPSGQSAFADLRAASPRFGVARLGEVQAQAATLDEAWRALLQSPAHRFELVEPTNTHMGVSVRRAPDRAGRPLITLVVVVAKRTSQRKQAELATELIGRFNLARHADGVRPLKQDAKLAALASRHARLMAERGNLDEATTDDSNSGVSIPIAVLAQRDVAKLEDVRVVMARLSDPLRLAPSSATLGGHMRRIGIGLWPQGVDGQWYVCVLVGEPTTGAR